MKAHLFILIREEEDIRFRYTEWVGGRLVGGTFEG